MNRAGIVPQPETRTYLVSDNDPCLRSIAVVLNWLEELKRLVPAN
jgi:hypothetical protein